MVGACALHVGDDHHPLDVQLVGALLIKKKLSSYWLQRHHLNCRGDDHLTSPHQVVEVDLCRVYGLQELMMNLIRRSTMIKRYKHNNDQKKKTSI